MPDYSLLLKRSFELVKKCKWLFVYAFVVATSSGGGSSQFNFSDNDFKNFKPTIPENLPDETAQVLGAFTTSLEVWLQSVPPSKWILLILSFVGLILLSIVIRLVMTGWAKGALIAGVDMGLRGEIVNLPNTTGKGFASMKRLIGFSLLTGVIVTGAVIAMILLFIFGAGLASILPDPLGAIFAFLGILTISIVIILSILILIMTVIYAERLIVLKNYSVQEALTRAFKLSKTKKTFFPTLLMGIINGIFSSTIGCLGVIALLVVFSLPAFGLVYPSIQSKTFPSWPIVLSLVILLIMFFSANLILRAAVTIIKFGNWNQMFEHVWKEVEGENE